MKSSVLYNTSNLVLHLKVIIYCFMYFYIPAILVSIHPKQQGDMYVCNLYPKLAFSGEICTLEVGVHS